MNTIYLLVDPRTGLGRYVGITGGSLAARMRKHLCMARHGEDTHRSRWIRQLLASGLKPLPLVLEQTPDRQRECFWIRHYRTAGLDLTNSTEGGEGFGPLTPEVRQKLAAAQSGRRHTLEARAKISAALREQHALGLRPYKAPSQPRQPRTAEQRANIALGRAKAVAAGKKPGFPKGQPRSEETKQKISEAKWGRLGHPVSEATRRKMSEAKRGNAGRRGQKLTVEHRQRLSLAKQGNKGRLGQPHTSETKAKISARKRERDAERARQKGGSGSGSENIAWLGASAPPQHVLVPLTGPT